MCCLGWRLGWIQWQRCCGVHTVGAYTCCCRYLSNLEDLVGGSFSGRSSFDADASSPVSPRLAALRAEPSAAAFDADSSLAAELVLELYQSHNSSSDALIMLSQLQVILSELCLRFVAAPRCKMPC